MPEENLPHTAAATWSGFIYQGRVALYHVLKLMCDKDANDLKELHVQMDSIEDFSIIKYGQNKEVVPITIHQVKAMKSTLYSSYEDAFKQLEQKKTDLNAASVKAYFHLAAQNELTKSQIEEVHPLLKIYCYENNAEYCALDDLSEKIKNGIKIAMQKHGVDGHGNDGNTTLLYDVMDKMIADKVVAIHALNHKGTPIREAAFDNTIGLNLFLNVLNQDIASILQDEQYFEAKIRSNVNQYFQNFCVESEDESWDVVLKNKMNTYIHVLNNYSSNDFKVFLQSIRPHKEISYINLKGYTDSNVPEDEFKDAFLETLKSIKESSVLNGFGWTCKELKQYYPTAINYPDTGNGRSKASERILKTVMSTIVDIPFNSDYLITSACNVDGIEAHANKVVIAPGQENENEKITRWKKVGLICIETAKEKINDKTD